MICGRVVGASSDLLKATSLADVPLQQQPAILLGEQGAAVERVDDQAAAPAAADFRAAHQEVSREVHAVDMQSRPPRHFHVHDARA